MSGEERKKEAAEKAPQDYRGEIVKDNYYDINDRFYGNNDVMAATPYPWHTRVWYHCVQNVVTELEWMVLPTM